MASFGGGGLAAAQLVVGGGEKLDGWGRGGSGGLVTRVSGGGQPDLGSGGERAACKAGVEPPVVVPRGEGVYELATGETNHQPLRPSELSITYSL